MNKFIPAAFLLLSTLASANYSLHITNVELNDWLELCDTDTSLELKNTFETVNPKTGEKIVIQTKNSCLWVDPSTNKEYWFYFSINEIVFGTQSPQIIKAKEIANKLKSIIVGDEGEKY
jgi:hypothetical protein